MRNLYRSTGFRLTIFTASLFVIFMIIMLVIYYLIAVQYVIQDIDAELAWQIQMLDQEYQSGSLNPSNPELVEPDTFFLLIDSSGQTIFQKLPRDSDKQRWLSQLLPELKPKNNSTQTLRGKAVSLSDGSRLVVAHELKDLHTIDNYFGQVSAWLLITILVLSVACGALVSVITLRRVEAINFIATDIMKGHLDRRIPLKGTNDEFDRLSINLNQMLDRIEKLMAGLRQVSTDLAHDLRTPLSRLRQNLEGARRNATCIEDYEQAIDKALVQNDEILDTFGALLKIATIGSGAYHKEFETISLSEVLETIEETYAPIIEDHKQRLVSSIEPALMVRADKKLITQMIVNLVENSIHHSPAETQISIAARKFMDGITVVISDTGPGVPEAEQKKIFQPFYRLESSRSTPGHGLGLSLVSAIADLHHITLTLSDNRPGLCVNLLFPPSPAGKP